VRPIPDELDLAMAGPLLCGGVTVFNPFLTCNISPTTRVGGLSSDANCGVSPGSTFLRRKLSPVTRNGLASSRDFLIGFLVSLLFTPYIIFSFGPVEAYTHL
jgi:hypothetical protein